MRAPRIKATPGTAVIPFVESGHGTMPDMVTGGGIEGASKTARETAMWSPSRLSPDQSINLVKDEADFRTADLATNDGLSQHAVRVQKNSIVGAQYRLNAKPDYRVIYGADTRAAQEYGYAHPGALRIPCAVADFHDLLLQLAYPSADHADDEAAVCYY